MISSDQRPPGSDWLVRRITDLERQVRELQAGRRLEAATIGAGGMTVKGAGGISVRDGGDLAVQGGGDVTIEDGGDLVVRGGEFRVQTSNGVDQLFVGPIFYGGVPAGNGLIYRRYNGQQFFTLEGSNPENQFFALRDEQGNIIFSDDAATGQGIARPWLPVNWAESDYTTWPGTTSGSFAAVCETAIPRQQPRLFVRIRHTTDVSGTTGEVRLMCNGTQLGSTAAVSFVISTTDIGPVDMPAGTFGEVTGLSVDARRTAGTGAVRAMVTASWTQQS